MSVHLDFVCLVVNVHLVVTVCYPWSVFTLWSLSAIQGQCPTCGHCLLSIVSINLVQCLLPMVNVHLVVSVHLVVKVYYACSVSTLCPVFQVLRPANGHFARSEKFIRDLWELCRWYTEGGAYLRGTSYWIALCSLSNHSQHCCSVCAWTVYCFTKLL